MVGVRNWTVRIAGLWNSGHELRYAELLVGFS